MTPNIELPTRPFALFFAAVTGVVACALLGAATNAINGAVSPQYYIAVLRWHGVEDVWRASIGQGIFEGSAFGFAYALVFAIGTGWITRVQCTYGFALKHLLWIIAAALVCWLLGGVAGMLLATVSPEFFRQTFPGVPEQFEALLAYAWVGGSIHCVEFGGMVCVAIGLVVMRANWQKQTNGRASDFSLVESVPDPLPESPDFQANKSRA